MDKNSFNQQMFEDRVYSDKELHNTMRPNREKGSKKKEFKEIQMGITEFYSEQQDGTGSV